MRIACVGAGPGGLFFAILAKKIQAVIDVTVYEQAPEGAARGWGVVFWPDQQPSTEQGCADHVQGLARPDAPGPHCRPPHLLRSPYGGQKRPSKAPQLAGDTP